MSKGSPEPRIIQGSDIIFECPSCSKSMAIDPKAAGLVIACPECGIDIKIPGGAPQSTPAPAPPSEEASITISQEKVQLLQQDPNALAKVVEQLPRAPYLVALGGALVLAIAGMLVQWGAEKPKPADEEEKAEE